MTIHSGWIGNFYEDFTVGDVYEHPLGRTVTDNDNIHFTLLTQNTAPVHFDHEYAAKTEFGRPLMNSAFTLSLVVGQSVTDISQNVFANLSWTDVTLPKPVFAGDTIHSRSAITALRESKSRPSVGIVSVETEGYNQRAETVITFSRSVMVYRRNHGPRFENKKMKGN